VFSAPHRRLNLLTGESILVSPQRTARPWQGQEEARLAEDRPRYDPACYLCPGNIRAAGARTPDYRTTFVFDNDFAALQPDTPPERFEHGGVLEADSERGVCRVACFSPRHDLTLGQMDLKAIRHVVDTWTDQYLELSALDWVNHVLIFENRGALMGASNPHPHGQIWANQRLPSEPALELNRQRAYGHNGSCLLCDYLAVELNEQERVVCQNSQFVAVVPFWAIWPYETLVLPRRHAGALPDLSSDERDGLADILGRLIRRYDLLFAATFPYSMGFHQPPTDGADHPEWHLHAHFYPPLLRSATVRKFVAGYELLAQPARDITPESAAQQLQALPDQ
jgi:UDPglucose--hexose-1-phosphate uridylyltransferase